MVGFFYSIKCKKKKIWIFVLISSCFPCVTCVLKKCRNMSQSGATALILPVRLFSSWCCRAAGPRCWSCSWAERHKPWSAGTLQVQFCLTRTVISSLSDGEEGQSAHPKSDWDTLRGERGRGGPRGLSVVPCVKSYQVLSDVPELRAGKIAGDLLLRLWIYTKSEDLNIVQILG